MDYHYGQSFPPKKFIKGKNIGTVIKHDEELFIILNVKGENITFLKTGNKIVSTNYTEIVWDSLLTDGNNKY